MIIAITIGSVAGVYAAGVRSSWSHAGTGRGIRRWRVWCFAAGVATLLVALFSPLDEMAEALLSAHMTQHVLLAIVAPPLVVAGAPMLASVWALPRPIRSRVAHAVRRVRWLSAAWRTLTALSVAWLLHAVALWTWHVPRFYTAALEHPLLHALEHVSFFGTAALMWWGILHPRRSRGAAYGTGIVVLFVTMLHSGALGALMALSRRVWFPVHAAGAATWGSTALADQKLAGLIVWVPGGMVYLIAMSVLLLARMRHEQRRRAASVAALALSN